MPRRNKPIKHEPFVFQRNEGGKVRYNDKNAAEKAADLRMLQHPNLELEVYQALDGGWYLTSVKKPVL
jgi:hypothetical protein